MNKLFTDNQKAIVNLPARNDTESELVFEFTFPAGSLDFEGQDFIFPDGFHVLAKVRWLDEGMLLTELSVEAALVAECARCLEPVNLEISDKLMYLYQLRGDESGLDSDLDLESETQYDDFMPVELEFFGRVLDIMPQIQESIYTLLPSKILCREDCAGLCPVCGKNLNEGPCSCVNEDVDPRLEALRNFVVE